MTHEQVEEIIIRNIRDFIGLNEAVLHASKEISDIIHEKDKELDTYHSLVDDATKEIKVLEEVIEEKRQDTMTMGRNLVEKDKEVSELKQEIERLKENNNCEHDYAPNIKGAICLRCNDIVEF